VRVRVRRRQRRLTTVRCRIAGFGVARVFRSAHAAVSAGALVYGVMRESFFRPSVPPHRRAEHGAQTTESVLVE
jgi:hypothetical protein